jgi:hypothetical protein
MRLACVLPALLAASPALAQQAAAVPEPVETVAPPADTRAASDTEPVWIAGLSGGVLDRSSGKDSPYSTVSLTRYQGSTYLRGAFTAYRGTLQQLDAALPSAYYIGSIGAGGNFGGWVADAYASYGWQDYGAVETDLGKRASLAGSGSSYFAAGLRGGRIFTLAPRLYATPTIGVQYVATRSLRTGFTEGEPADFETRERAWTGLANFRLDRAFGRDQQHFAGLSYTHYESDNGLTALRFSPGSAAPVGDPTPDGWDEFGASATIGLSRRLWLDGQVSRTAGTVSGDSTTWTLGLRWRP